MSEGFMYSPSPSSDRSTTGSGSALFWPQRIEKHHRRVLRRHSHSKHPTTAPTTVAMDEDVLDALSIGRECVKVGAYEQAIAILHVCLERFGSAGATAVVASREAAECAYILGTALRHESYYERAIDAFVLCATIREFLYGPDDGSAKDARTNASSPVLRRLFPVFFAGSNDAPSLTELTVLIGIMEDRYLLGMTTDAPELVQEAIFCGLDTHYSLHHHNNSQLDYHTLSKRTRLAESPLLLAIRSNALQVVRMLVHEGGASPNHWELHGISPLIVAASLPALYSQRTESIPTGDMIRALLEAGADPKGVSSRDGSTALHAACACATEESPNLVAVQLLIGYGADMDARNQAGETPLMVAAMNGHLGLVTILLEAKADVDAAKDDGVTALFFAAQNGREAVCQLLLHRGASANALRTTDELSVLQIAAAHGFTSICELLITHKARAYHRNREGVTAADLARSRGHESLSAVLGLVQDVQ